MNVAQGDEPMSDDRYEIGYKQGREYERGEWEYSRANIRLGMFVVAYIIAGLTTFAWNYTDPSGRESAPDAAMAGAFWPIYWSGKGALILIRSIRGPVKEAAGAVPGLTCFNTEMDRVLVWPARPGGMCHLEDAPRTQINRP